MKQIKQKVCKIVNSSYNLSDLRNRLERFQHWLDTFADWSDEKYINIRMSKEVMGFLLKPLTGSQKYLSKDPLIKDTLISKDIGIIINKNKLDKETIKLINDFFDSVQKLEIKLKPEKIIISKKEVK